MNLRQQIEAPSASEIRDRMKRAQLTQTRAAQLLGHPRSYVADILAGRRAHPGYRLRFRLASLLEILERGGSPEIWKN